MSYGKYDADTYHQPPAIEVRRIQVRFFLFLYKLGVRSANDAAYRIARVNFAEKGVRVGLR